MSNATTIIHGPCGVATVTTWPALSRKIFIKPIPRRAVGQMRSSRCPRTIHSGSRKSSQWRAEIGDR